MKIILFIIVIIIILAILSVGTWYIYTLVIPKKDIAFLNMLFDDDIRSNFLALVEESKKKPVNRDLVNEISIKFCAAIDKWMQNNFSPESLLNPSYSFS